MFGDKRWHPETDHSMAHTDPHNPPTVELPDDSPAAAVQQSEQRFRLLVQNAGMGFWEWEVDVAMRWEPMHNRLIGLPEPQVRGTPEQLLQVVHPEDRVAVSSALRAAVECAGNFASQFRVVHSDGIVRWIMSQGQAVDVKGGRVARMIGSVIDITDQKRTEMELRRREAELARVQQIGGVGGIDVDVARGLTGRRSPEYVRLHGLPEGTATESHQGWLARLHPEDREQADAALREALAGACSTYENEYRIIRPDDGRTRWILAKADIERDANGRAQRLIGAHIDITERVELEQRVTQAAEALAMESRRKDEFLAMLSHELRNPLAPIRSAVQILRMRARQDEDPIQKQAHEIIERQVANLTKLVGDLLEVSRVISGRIRLAREIVDLNRIAAHAIETAQPLIDQHAHGLHFHPAEEPLWCDADAGRMEEVFINLLNNAAKYTRTGGQISVWIERIESAAPALARFRIRDNGVGIDPELLPRVFDLFTQADRSLAHSGGGLGVGLSLAHRIVQLHGAAIHAQSPPADADVGTEFSVDLPLTTPPISAGAEPSLPAAPPEEVRRRVLVVDDNIDHLAMLTAGLQERGYRVQTATSGPDALDAARTGRPEVILLDIGLPGLDGYEVARRLRADAALRRARLVALTGYGREGDLEQAREAGFDAHLTKPCTFQDLERALQALGETQGRDPST
jgi:PAS domain S-box-containing protein